MIIKSFFAWVDFIFDRMCIVLGAFIGSQIAPFMQQYIQRLAGHVDELHYLVSHIQQAALQSNKTMEQYIEKFLNQLDTDFVLQGQLMQDIVQRLAHFEQALQAFYQSAVWMRPFTLLKYADYSIMQKTVDAFQPSVSLSFEGAYYAVLGSLTGFIFYKCCASLIKLSGSKLRLISSTILISKRRAKKKLQQQ